MPKKVNHNDCYYKCSVLLYNPYFFQSYKDAGDPGLGRSLTPGSPGLGQGAGPGPATMLLVATETQMPGNEMQNAYHEHKFVFVAKRKFVAQKDKRFVQASRCLVSKL